MPSGTLSSSNLLFMYSRWEERGTVTSGSPAGQTTGMVGVNSVRKTAWDRKKWWEEKNPDSVSSLHEPISGSCSGEERLGTRSSAQAGIKGNPHPTQTSFQCYTLATTLSWGLTKRKVTKSFHQRWTRHFQRRTKLWGAEHLNCKYT